MNLKYIYWFSFYDLNAPSVRYRAKYVLENLSERSQIQYQIVYPGYSLKNIIHFIKVYFAALLFREKDSLIVIQKIYTRRIYSLALKLLLYFRKRYTLYDIDDAEYIRFPGGSTDYFLKRCEVCSVASKSLMEYSRKLNPNVLLLTSPVIRHNKIKKETNNIFTIGWIGCYNAHEESLKQLFYPSLLDIEFDIRLVILGISKEKHRHEIMRYYEKSPNVRIEIPESINWLDELSVYNRIKDFDIGIAPLLDNEFNRAKSAFKLKQYFSCGVPVLCSRVGENVHFLENGKNGYFCDSPEEYKRSILHIMELERDDYQQLCANALQQAENFSMDRFSRNLLAYFN